MKTSDNGTCTSEDNDRLAPDDYDWSTSKTANRFQRMRDALKKQDREILLSICGWGYADVYKWWVLLCQIGESCLPNCRGNDTGVNWRSTGDIFPGWDNVVRILNINSFKMHHTNFWGRNDADMLEIGNGLNEAESRSHFAFWAAMKSRLLIGADVSKLNDGQLGILKNKFLLDFNQDNVFGAPAMPYRWGTNLDWTFNASWPAQYWSGQSKAGTLVVLFNPGEKSMNMAANLTEIPGWNGKPHKATDVWAGKEIGCIQRGLTASIQPHDTAVLLFTEECEVPVSDRRMRSREGRTPYGGWTLIEDRV